MIELFKNPITIIFGLLATFFVLMGFGRHLIRKRNLREEGPQDKPYNVSDPYAEPEDATLGITDIAEPQAKLATSGETMQKRYFKEFGGDSSGSKPLSEKGGSGYVWE